MLIKETSIDRLVIVMYDFWSRNLQCSGMWPMLETTYIDIVVISSWR